MSSYVLTPQGELLVDKLPLFTGITPQLTLAQADPGGFLIAHNPVAGRQEFSLGRFCGVEGFLALYRPEPAAMAPNTGLEERDILPETQFLLAKDFAARFILLIPLVEAAHRSALRGTPDDGIQIVCHGDAPAPTCTLVYVGVGMDPFLLVRDSWAAIAGAGQGRHRRAAATTAAPDEHLKWCTAGIADELTNAAILDGIARLNGQRPFPLGLLLDHRWQTENARGELTGFEPNPLLGQDLAACVAGWRRAGVNHVAVSHPLTGGRAGVAADAFRKFPTDTTPVRYAEDVLHHRPDLFDPAAVRLPAGDQVGGFYAEFYQFLQDRGVDDVVVEDDGLVEGAAPAMDGRVQTQRRYWQAVAAAASTAFDCRITQSGGSNEALFSAAAPGAFRLGGSANSQQLEKQSGIVYANACASLFLADLRQPDWGPFHTSGPAGFFNAAARSVSGGPVIIADAPGEHNQEVLDKLMLADGSLLQPTGSARPTQDCLFEDPRTDDAVLKICNSNTLGHVIGVFNCQYHEQKQKRHFVAGTIRPNDIPGLSGEVFALYSHQAAKLTACRRQQRVSVWLNDFGFEIITVMPVQHGFAAIGLADRFNSGAAVESVDFADSKHCRVRLRHGGRFVAWAEVEPEALIRNDTHFPFEYDRREKKLQTELPTDGPIELTIQLGEPAPAEPRPTAMDWTPYVRDSRRKLVFRLPPTD